MHVTFAWPASKVYPLLKVLRYLDLDCNSLINPKRIFAVEVPYFFYSSKTFDGQYSEPSDMLVDGDGQENLVPISGLQNEQHFRSSTCREAFMACQGDSTCRIRRASFGAACKWHHQSNACKKRDCLYEIQRFFLLVRPKFTHALLFCRCEEGDSRCLEVKKWMHPACAVVDSPPPTCSNVMEKCQQDKDCRYMSFTCFSHLKSCYLQTWRCLITSEPLANLDRFAVRFRAWNTRPNDTL